MSFRARQLWEITHMVLPQLFIRPLSLHFQCGDSKSVKFMYKNMYFLIFFVCMFFKHTQGKSLFRELDFPKPVPLFLFLIRNIIKATYCDFSRCRVSLSATWFSLLELEAINFFFSPCESHRQLFLLGYSCLTPLPSTCLQSLLPEAFTLGLSD